MSVFQITVFADRISLLVPQQYRQLLCLCVQGQEKVRGPRPRPSEIWQRLQPSVECGNSAMTVTFRRRRASQVLLHRGEAPCSNFSSPGVKVSDKHSLKHAFQQHVWQYCERLEQMRVCFINLCFSANESSVPLSRPPPRCGYSVHTTWRDLRLMAQYDACHVTRKV